MPRAMYICPVCHKNVLASKAIHIKTRYYHKACLDKKIKKEKEKIDNNKLTKKQREQYERALKQSALPESLKQFQKVKPRQQKNSLVKWSKYRVNVQQKVQQWLINTKKCMKDLLGKEWNRL
ncbi:hypothetical protein DW958_13895 [Ruminococcus sp. AM46-18]|nr:hypothetical protein DW958_13895 [Ruminococcus sp. AM46-18]